MIPSRDQADRSLKRYLPWVVATALFMEQLDSTIINTAIPAMAESLQVTPLSLKAVVTSYILSLAVGIPISGWMADRFGTRRIFSAAVAIFAQVPSTSRFLRKLQRISRSDARVMPT